MHLQWTGKPKIGYSTIEQAESHRKELQERDKAVVSIYMCLCGMYHVGHLGASKFDKRKQSYDEALVGKLIGAIKNLVNNPKRTAHD